MDLKALADKLASIDKLEKTASQLDKKVPGEQPTMDPKGDVTAMQKALASVRAPMTAQPSTQPAIQPGTSQQPNKPINDLGQDKELQQKNKPGEPTLEQQSGQMSREDFIKDAIAKIKKEPSKFWKVPPELRAEVKAGLGNLQLPPRPADAPMSKEEFVQDAIEKVKKDPGKFWNVPPELQAEVKAGVGDDVYNLADLKRQMATEYSRGNKAKYDTLRTQAQELEKKLGIAAPAGNQQGGRREGGGQQGGANQDSNRQNNQRGSAQSGNWYRGTEGDYTIEPGDTLSKIAKRSGVSVDDLKKLNNIQDVNKIIAGSKLKTKVEQPAQQGVANPSAEDPDEKLRAEFRRDQLRRIRQDAQGQEILSANQGSVIDYKNGKITKDGKQTHVWDDDNKTWKQSVEPTSELERVTIPRDGNQQVSGRLVGNKAEGEIEFNGRKVKPGDADYAQAERALIQARDRNAAAGRERELSAAQAETQRWKENFRATHTVNGVAVMKNSGGEWVDKDGNRRQGAEATPISSASTSQDINPQVKAEIDARNANQELINRYIARGTNTQRSQLNPGDMFIDPKTNKVMYVHVDNNGPAGPQRSYRQVPQYHPSQPGMWADNPELLKWLQSSGAKGWYDPESEEGKAFYGAADKNKTSLSNPFGWARSYTNRSPSEIDVTPTAPAAPAAKPAEKKIGDLSSDELRHMAGSANRGDAARAEIRARMDAGTKKESIEFSLQSVVNELLNEDSKDNSSADAITAAGGVSAAVASKAADKKWGKSPEAPKVEPSKLGKIGAKMLRMVPGGKYAVAGANTAWTLDDIKRYQEAGDETGANIAKLALAADALGYHPALSLPAGLISGGLDITNAVRDFMKDDYNDTENDVKEEQRDMTEDEDLQELSDILKLSKYKVE